MISIFKMLKCPFAEQKNIPLPTVTVEALSFASKSGWSRIWLHQPQNGPGRLFDATAPGVVGLAVGGSGVEMRCGALPSLSAVVVLSLTLPRQSQRERLYRHLTLLCVFRTHRARESNGVFQRRTTDRMRDRERASSPRSHCFC